MEYNCNIITDPTDFDRPLEHVFLLHGMFGKAEQWQACAAHLAPRWQVSVPSLPFRYVEPDIGAIDVLGDHIAREMDSKGVEKAVIAGNSFGGHIAARMALRYSDRVSGLVLTGSSGLFEHGFERSVPRRPTETYIRNKMLEVFHDPAHVTDQLVDETRELLNNLRDVLQMVRMAKCAKHDNIREVLPTITCPVLLVWGEDDRITPPAVAREFHDLLPCSELHMIDRCGHVPMFERPEVFNGIIESFLMRLTGIGSATLPSDRCMMPSLHS